MLSSFSSLRAKLLYSYFLFMLLAGLVAAISFWFYLKRERLTSITSRLDNLHIKVLQTIEKQRDFLAYEAVDNKFYATGKSQYLMERDILIKDVKQELAKLSYSEDIERLTLNHEISALTAQFSRYEQLSNDIVKKMQVRGFIDYGLEGKMRRYAHAIENDKGVYNKLQLLTMRRHEKDYIIRKDRKYAIKLEELCNQMRKVLKSKFGEGHPSDTLLLKYLITFKQLVEIEEVIGVNKSMGLQANLDILSEDLEHMIDATTQKANIYKAALIKDIQLIFVIVIIVSVVLGVLLNYLLAIALTRPIRILSSQINRIVENNFENRLQPIQVTTQDEVGLLTQNFNSMVDKIHDHLIEIQEKSCMLESQNEELQAINTQLSESESDLRKLNAVKDKFFFIISHDLRGPLCTINGFLLMLRQYVDSFTTEEIKEFAINMDSSVKRLLDLLSNLLQWSSSQSGDISFTPAALPLHEQIKKNIDLFNEAAEVKQNKLSFEIDSSNYIYADANMFDFIVRNLLSNAIKFTSANGQVRIVAEKDEIFTIIHVIDDGIGIEEEAMKKLFLEKLHHSTPGTAKEKGTGFGLLLCKDFVRRNGGTISINSVTGSGTTVSFSIPNVNINGNINYSPVMLKQTAKEYTS